MNILILVFAEVVYPRLMTLLYIKERVEIFCNVHCAQAFEGCMGSKGSLIAWTNASLLCAGEEFASECGWRVQGENGQMTELVVGARRLERPKSSTVWRTYATLAGIPVLYPNCQPVNLNLH